jgi:hypothetical protein
MTYKGAKYVFNTRHTIPFCLEVGCCNSKKEVKSVTCRLCLKYGREEVVVDLVNEEETETNQPKPKKRKKSTSIKSWTSGSFVAANYRSHLTGQHPQKYAEYCELKTEGEKETFLNKDTRRTGQSSMTDYMSKGYQVEICEDIVQKVLPCFFDLDDDDDRGRYERTAESLFSNRSSSSSSSSTPSFLIVIKNTKRFRLAVKLLANGSSFEKVKKDLKAVVEETGMGVYGGCSNGIVSQYSKWVCLMSLQRLRDVSKSCWAMALALDGGTHFKRGYMDVRVRMFHDGKINNHHVMAVPMFESHTANYITGLVLKVLGALFPGFTQKCIGITTDGENKMTGVHKGVATQLADSMGVGVRKVWCAIHQVDLIIKKCIQGIDGGEWVRALHNITNHLRNGKGSSESGLNSCPKLIDTRWLSYGCTLQYFFDNMIRIRKYLDQGYKIQRSTLVEGMPVVDTFGPPSPSWWMKLIFLKGFLHRSNLTVTALQSHGMVLEQQRQHLDSLSQDFKKLLGATDASSSSGHATRGTWTLGTITTTHRNALKTFIDRCAGYDGIELITHELKDTPRKNALEFSVKLVAEMIIGIQEINPARHGNTFEGWENVGRTYPGDIKDTGTTGLYSMMKSQVERLGLFYGDDVEALALHKREIFQEHASMSSGEYDEDFVDMPTGPNVSFEAAWTLPLQRNFPRLFDFAGSIATVFPNNASVEQDISVLKLEKTVQRKSLADFPLEGRIHSKTFDLTDI